MNISVIIPVYNAEKTIENSIQSVFDQSYVGDIEIVAVNDGSTDQSLAILEKLQANKPANRFSFIIINQENGGVSKARNVGMQVAAGDLIALLDSDDEWLPEKLSKQIETMNENPTIDFLGCSRNKDVLTILGKTITSIHKATVKELLIKMYPQTSTAIFKRKLYEELGGYNESLTHCEDGNLWVRYCANSNFYYSPESLVITGGGKPHFGHSGLSANLKAMEQGNEFTIREARENGLISYPFYLAVFFYSKVKYLRRLVLTKVRMV